MKNESSFKIGSLKKTNISQKGEKETVADILSSRFMSGKGWIIIPDMGPLKRDGRDKMGKMASYRSQSARPQDFKLHHYIRKGENPPHFHPPRNDNTLSPQF